jgi:hypothetical protein
VGKIKLGPSFIPNADVARNVCYPRRISLRTARTGLAHSAPFAAIDRSLSARAAIHVDASNMLQEQYLATNATLPAYCPSSALLKLQTDAGVARV